MQHRGLAFWWSMHLGRHVRYLGARLPAQTLSAPTNLYTRIESYTDIESNPARPKQCHSSKGGIYNLFSSRLRVSQLLPYQSQFVPNT